MGHLGKRTIGIPHPWFARIVMPSMIFFLFVCWSQCKAAEEYSKGSTRDRMGKSLMFSASRTLT